MQKLHLVGFTTDQKGLILSARRGARSGSFHLPLDDALAEAVEELRSREAEEEAGDEPEEEVRTPRVESALPVREIQARLRQGRSVPDVAKAAGVDPEWVERFAAPVFAEQAQVIMKVRAAPLRRARLGPSTHPIGEAVQRNLTERGVAMSPDEHAAAWTTRQLADGRWRVRFAFRHRNKDQTLSFEYDDAAGTVAAVDRVSGQMGYVAPPPGASSPSPARPTPSPPSGPSPRPTAKRATVTTGFRPDPSAKPVSRPAKERERASAAMRKAAAQHAVEAERAATRKAKEKAQAAVREEKAAKADAARLARERAAAERAKAAAAKKKAAEQARRKAAKQATAQARRAEAALVAAERAAAKKAAAAKKVAEKKAAAAIKTAVTPTPVKKAAAKPAAAKRAATKRPAAKKAAAKPAPVKKSAAKKAPVTKGAAPAAADKTTRPAAVTRAMERTTAPTANPAAPARKAVSKKPATPRALPATEGFRVLPSPEAPRPAKVVTLEDLDADAASILPTRPRFRPGSVEPVGERDGQGDPAANGERPPSPPGRPRRTRPLRAT